MNYRHSGDRVLALASVSKLVCQPVCWKDAHFKPRATNRPQRVPAMDEALLNSLKDCEDATLRRESCMRKWDTTEGERATRASHAGCETTSEAASHEGQRALPRALEDD